MIRSASDACQTHSSSATARITQASTLHDSLSAPVHRPQRGEPDPSLPPSRAHSIHNAPCELSLPHHHTRPRQPKRTTATATCAPRTTTRSPPRRATTLSFLPAQLIGVATFPPAQLMLTDEKDGVSDTPIPSASVLHDAGRDTCREHKCEQVELQMLHTDKRSEIKLFARSSRRRGRSEARGRRCAERRERVRRRALRPRNDERAHCKPCAELGAVRCTAAGSSRSWRL